MIKSFKSEIYPITFYICIGKSVNQIASKICKDVEIDKEFLLSRLTPFTKAAGFCVEEGGIIVISIKKVNTPHYIGILSHEISHATFFICERLGIDFTASPQEAYCYLNGWITEKIWKLIEVDIAKN